MKQRRKKPSSSEPEFGPAYRVRQDGALCIAFVNAASPKRAPQGAGSREAGPREAGTLATYSDLLAWGVEHGVLDAAALKRLVRAAAERPVDAAIAVHRSGELRALVERLLSALAEHQAPDPADLEALNAELAGGERRLVRTATGCRWAWTAPEVSELERFLWPVVLCAADLLTSENHRRVRRCGGGRGCDLLFVDRSPGFQRKWCRGDGCGRRARARRRYRETLKPRREERRRQRREGS